MKKTSKRVLICCIIALVIAAIGVTWAFLFKTDNADNSFVPATVSCKVVETFDGREYSDGTHQGLKKTTISVQNTGNYPAYIRLRLVSYWVDADGNVVGVPSKMPDIKIAHDDWIAGANDTYYFTKPVSPDKLTENLCKSVELETTVDASGNTVYQVLDVFAEAIQANPETAVSQAWGVTVENGVIISVSE